MLESLPRKSTAQRNFKTQGAKCITISHLLIWVEWIDFFILLFHLTNFISKLLIWAYHSKKQLIHKVQPQIAVRPHVCTQRHLEELHASPRQLFSWRYHLSSRPRFVDLASYTQEEVDDGVGVDFVDWFAYFTTACLRLLTTGCCLLLLCLMMTK